MVAKRQKKPKQKLRKLQITPPPESRNNEHEMQVEAKASKCDAENSRNSTQAANPPPADSDLHQGTVTITESTKKREPEQREVEDHNLENVLLKASMPDKTVILTTLNRAWAAPNSVFDLFLHSFRIGNETAELLNYVLVIAMDEKAYNRCIAIQTHCYYLTSNGTDFSGEKAFMTPDYLKMMWRRIEFLGTVLDLGYNFIFTDTDIMWFRNPFPRLHPDADFQIACDFFKGNSSNKHRNLPNGGFTYVKSNNQTSKFYKFWYKSRESYPGLHDQDVLNNKIKLDPHINEI
ncbi:hypothetical protein AgCh_032191 [Apium graveolens]